MKPFFNSQSNMAFSGFDQSLSLPTAGQGIDDSGNEIGSGFVFIKGRLCAHVVYAILVSKIAS